MTKTRPRRSKINPLPDFVPPCLAKLGQSVPIGDAWGHEIKFDGYRLQVRIDADDVRLLTRTGLDWTERFGTLAKAFRALKLKSALLDGEAIVEDARGASNFSALVEALQTGNSGRIVFVAFDLLHIAGENLMDLPLEMRKARLQPAVVTGPSHERIRYSEHIVCDGRKLFDEVCKLGLEGIISKRLDRAYHSGRHDDWRKTKCISTDEFVISGYVDSAAAKTSVGALVLALHSGKTLVYAGRVGTGFTREVAAALWSALQPLRRDASPLSAELDAAQRKDVRWVRPKLVAQIEYRALTADKLLRHASFKALREDKPARLVKRP